MIFKVLQPVLPSDPTLMTPFQRVFQEVFDSRVVYNMKLCIWSTKPLQVKKILLCDAFFLFLQKISLLTVLGFPTINLPQCYSHLCKLSQHVFYWVWRTTYQFHDHPHGLLCIYICIYVVLSFEDTIVVASVALPSHTPTVPLLYFRICFPPVHNRTLLLGRVREPLNLTCFLPVCSVISMSSATPVQYVFMTNAQDF